MDPRHMPEPIENEELLQIYLQSGEESVRVLSAALEQLDLNAESETDLARLEQVSHRVKGASFQFGFPRPGELAERIEALSRFMRDAGRRPGPEDLQVLHEAVERLSASMDAVRRRDAFPAVADICERLEGRLLSDATPGASLLAIPVPEVRIDLDQVEGLPALPEVIIRIMELIEGEQVSVNRIAEAVEQDPSLAASVLKIVNSPFYGLSNRITSIRHAVVLLGFRTVRNLAMSAILIRTFGGGREDGRIGRQRLWRHTVASAVGARLLARITRSWEPEEAFLAGLMHTMGIIVLEQCFHRDYLRVLDMVDAEGIAFRAAQLEVFGCTDAEVGGRLAERWNFPAPVADAIARQHDPVLAEAAPVLAALVHLACRMTPCVSDTAQSDPASQAAAPDPGNPCPHKCEVWESDALDLRALALVGIGPVETERFVREFAGEWQRADALLGLVG